MTIQVLNQQGMSSRSLARELGIARQTVINALSGKSDGSYGPRVSKPTKLSPFHEYLLERIRQAVPECLSATVLYREIHERGYTGGISQLKEYIASLRPDIEQEPIKRFETEPGQQMQTFVVFRLELIRSAHLGHR